MKPTTKETVAKYRNVFGTSEGKEVFFDILEELGFFKSEILTTEDATKNNFAKLLLAKVGSWHANNSRALANAFLSLPGFAQIDDEEETSDGDRIDD